jgi:two-component system sensor histidine kinase KdpD
MADDDHQRPDPDALLAEAKRATRGRLKIFLGAAPGVGKTYAMLESGHERRRESIDVVIGVVETHGRPETERLVTDIERIPLRSIDYRGKSFQEMDLDAIIARRPKLVLVDELAHTNIPGSSHLKRFQDVEDILAVGIDVYSTINIQHIESLNDIVERITGVQVRETVPDSVLAGADEIELIDLPPQDLIARMAEGKVYVPEQARRAAHNFFTPGNLTALRELALRHAAERVDTQMVNYMRAHAISGPWPTRERVIVCIGDSVAGSRLVRATKRIAERRQVPWIAVYVETARHASLPEAEKDRIAQAMRLAAQLGGETVVLQGEDVAAELVTYAREHNCTQLIVGRPRRAGWRRLYQGPSLTDRIVARTSQFDVLLLGGDEGETVTPELVGKPEPRKIDWLAYAIATAAIIGATGVGFAIYTWLPLANISVAFLLAVLLVAMWLGRGPAIFASVLSFVSYIFFFTEPRYAFGLENTQNLLTLAFFLAAAVIVSNLASRVRRQVDAAKTNARRTMNLYDFSRKIAVAPGRDEVLWAVVHHVAATIRGKSLVLLPNDGLLEIAAGYPPEDKLDERETAAAAWTWSAGKPSGRGSTTLPASEWLFLPLKTVRGPVGVMGVQIEGKDVLSPEETRLVETLADQAAVAIERTTLVADVEAAKLASETERLRSALLSSLSHDLRTPLVSILGAATSLLNYHDSLSTENRRDLAETIRDEAERLNRFVQNLLDMTKLGSGALRPNVDWADMRDIVGRAIERAERLLQDRDVKIDIDPALPLLQVDPVLMEQVFFNLIDNACKYSQPGSTVTVWARRRAKEALIEICDQGVGIPEADRQRVFDMFYRVKATDAQTAGTGLGLAIARGVVEAHGGTVKAEAGLHGTGTCIIIHLPLPEAPPPAPAAELVEAKA